LYVGKCEIFVTLPAIEAWTALEIYPEGFAIGSPTLTISPTDIIGSAGDPVCWERGSITFLGIKDFLIGLSEARSLNVNG